MDIMKIESALLRTVVSKLLAREVKKKTGYEIDIRINEFSAEVANGEMKIHLDADGEMNPGEFAKLAKDIII